MTTLRLLGFSGEVPRLIPRLLNDSNAQSAINARLDDGGLTPVRESRHVAHLAIGQYPERIDTIYQHNGRWFGWEGYVTAVPGPVANDRLYIFGDGKPKVVVGNVEFDLAIERPSQTPAATVSGTATSEDISTRLYVYTLVTDMSEETEPSPVSNAVEWKPGQQVTLTGFSTTSPNRTITHQRIYRSQTGTSGGTDFYLIQERPVSSSEFIDIVPVDGFMERLPSRDWTAPPDTLKGGIGLPNGMIAAFTGKDLYICEPWRPHAWPEGYVLTTDYEIVGLGAYGNTIVVTTTGHPYIVTGATPETMRMEKLELNLPCINPRGIQDLGYTVVYPSHEGLVTVSNGTAQVTTTSLLTREEWQSMRPVTMVGGQINARYFSAYDYHDVRGNQHTGSLIFDFSGEQPFIIRSQISPKSFFYNIVTGQLFYLQGRDVFEYDAPGQINKTLYWKSKEFVLPRPVNFGAILLEVEEELTEEQKAAIEAEQQAAMAENVAMMHLDSIEGEMNSVLINFHALNGDILRPIPKFNNSLSVQIHADGKLVASVSKYNTMARLPSGFLARKWEVSVTSDIPVTQITLATTGAELMSV